MLAFTCAKCVPHEQKLGLGIEVHAQRNGARPLPQRCMSRRANMCERSASIYTPSEAHPAHAHHRGDPSGGHASASKLGEQVARVSLGLAHFNLSALAKATGFRGDTHRL